MANDLTTDGGGLRVQSVADLMTLGKIAAASGLVPKDYQGQPEKCAGAIAFGAELGLAPMQALQCIANINGRPAIWGDAAKALCMASPTCEGIEEFIEGEGTPNPKAVCVCKRRGHAAPVRHEFSVEDAKRAGLWGKQGPWSQYPKRMLQMRARGFALRDAFPDILRGLVTAEEAGDYLIRQQPPAVRPEPLQHRRYQQPPQARLPAPAVEPEDQGQEHFDADEIDAEAKA
ncbi:MAG: recombinase RecT [Planctomycetes bacterium]|nr:recombinase RecT [Planctomycetota bacterium]